MQLKKRARRAPGRPSADSSVKDAVRKAYDVVRHPDAVEAAIKKRRPIRACGIPPRKVTTDEIISALDVSRSEHYRRMSGAKSMKSHERSNSCNIWDVPLGKEGRIWQSVDAYSRVEVRFATF